MASREFLKILQLARIGDVSAQQNLASAYLTGAFKTPIQPANALIWLEKSYLSLKNQFVSTASSGNTEISEIDVATPEMLAMFEHVSSVPLAATLSSPAFSFGWELFWKLAKANVSASYAAQWQLAELLLDPNKKKVIFIKYTLFGIFFIFTMIVFNFLNSDINQSVNINKQNLCYAVMIENTKQC